MKMLGRYLKPFLLVLLISVGMLFIQSYANLKLPDYMSNMVDIGIQKKGIGDEAPKSLTSNSMKLIQNFTKTNFEGSYEKKGELYTRKEVNEKELEGITNTYNRAVYAIFDMMRESDSSNASGDMSKAKEISNEDFKKLVEGLLRTPEATRQRYIDRSESIDGMFASQMGNFFTKLDYSLQSIDIEKLQMNYIYKIGLFMILISIVGAIATIISNYISAFVASKVSTNIRKDVFSKVMGFSSQEYNKFPTSSLITRTTNDITQVQNTLAFCIKLLLFAPIQGIGAFIMAIEKSPSLSWIIGVSVGTVLLIVVCIFILLVPKFKRIQVITDKINAVTRENLIGVMDVRAFNNQEIEKKRFDKVSSENRKLNKAIQVVFGFMMPIMTFVMNVTVLGIIWFSISKIEGSIIQVGDMMAYIQYTIQIIFSFLLLTMIFVMVPRAVVSLSRINQILSTDFTILDEENSLDNVLDGDIEFNNVSFSYKNAKEPVLKNINLKFEKGAYTAIIGTTGSGKSTLVNLIPRFFDVTDGELTINGINVKKYKQASLRGAISYSPQKSMLFKGNILENISFGDKNATQEEIEKILEVAQAKDFLDEKEGLITEVAQLGKNFSGGQKQRLSIARALIKKANIFIFDDSFSALDAATDARLREGVRELLKDKTIIIVAQRLGTVINADKIVVLDKGEVVGVGKHEELMKSCSTYIDIANSQLGVEVFGE